MSDESEQLKLRLDSWIAEGKGLLSDMIKVDDGSMEMSDMQDVIINGLGVPDEHK